MERAHTRKLVYRAVAGVVLVLVAGGVWAWTNRTSLETRYAGYKFRNATTDEDRAKWAGALAGQGDAGLTALVEFAHTSAPPTRAAALAALGQHLATLPDGDPRAVLLCGQILDAFAGCDDAGREALLAFLPTILKRGGTGHAAKCRDVAAAGLKMPGVACRLIAIRTAMHPAVHLRTEVLPLLNADEAEVRRAALFAVGPATDDDPVIGDEDLFRWLHDSDKGVRTVCQDVLVSRGRTDREIAFGRRLTEPVAADRLRLLLDLRYDDELADPEPWLERLSRDPDPGVRAGAARVAVEVATDRRLPVPMWVARLADTDTNATVRRVAGYYRALPADGVRTVGGP